MAKTLSGFKVIGDTSKIGAGSKKGSAVQTSTTPSSNGSSRTLGGFKVIGDTSKIGAKAAAKTTQQTGAQSATLTQSTTRYPQPMDNVGRQTGTNSRLLADTKQSGTLIPSLDNGRVGKVISGAAKSVGSAYTNLGGVLAEGAGKLNTRIANQNAGDSLQSDHDAVKRYEKMLRDVKWANGRAMSAKDVKQVQGYLASAKRRIAAHEGYTKAVERSDKAVADKAYQKADRLSQSSAADVAQAKEGLGPVGQFAVDLGVQGVQMAGDVAASAVIPGAGLALMTARSAGSSAQQARQAGASYDQQLAYGLGSGALSLGTEKISNVAGPFKKAFGAGLADKAAGKLIAKFGESTAAQIMSSLAKRPAGKLALSMISEGGEEFLEDVVQPILQRATYDPSAKFDWGEALYDAAVGAAMGGIGGALDVVRGRSNAPTPPQEAAGAQTDVREGSYAPVEQVSAEGSQNAASGVETAANKGETVQIVERLRESIPGLNGTEPVSTVSSKAIPFVEGRTMAEKARKMFEAIKGVVSRPGFGDIDINGRSVKDDLSHGVGGAKAAVIPAIPEVLRRGQQIDFQQNWKGRPYDGYVFAAPVTMDGETAYVAAVVKRTSKNRFYLHEVIDANGNVIKIDAGDRANPTSLATNGDAGTQSQASMDMAPAEASLVGPEPTASSAASSPVEGTRPLNANDSIAQGAENVKNGDAVGFDATGDARYDNLGSARQGFTTPGMEGAERTSRFAESMPYNQWQEAATGLSREDYAKIFRYESQTEGKSMHLAEELVYVVKDGKKTFLRDIDEGAFHELVQSLDDATAWNGPQMDAARLIQSELQGKSANNEIPDDEYTNFLKIMREHETSTGQGVQANAKWSRNDNNRGQSTELDAWNNLEKSKLSDAEKHDAFQKIVKWDTDIEAVKSGDTQAMKDIILDVANERGVLGGTTKKIADKALDSLTFDQLKQFAYASTSAMSTDATPANAGRKVKTIQILSMLSNPKTASKNIVGNTSFYLLDALSMKGGALLDTAVSKLTGTRSVANEKALSREALQSAMKAANMSIAEIALDVDMGSDQSRYGTGSQRTFKMNGEGVFNTGTGVDKFGERVLSTLERNQAYLLNATDEFFKGAARNVEGNIQKLVDEGKIKTTDKNYARNQAEQLAKYRTFQDNSKLSVVIQEVHDALNLWGFGDSGRKRNGRTIHSFGAGDIAAPFIRVAGNLVSRGAEYSPYNVIKGTGEIVGSAAKAAGGNTDVSLQAKGVSDFARGMTGTMVAAGFMAIAKMGLMRKADDEDDEKVAALNRAEGMTGTQFNWSAFQRMLSGGDTQWQNGDTLIDISSIEPLNLLADLGAEMAKSDENPVISSFKATPKSLVDASSSLPVVQFIGDVGTDILKYGNDPIESISKEAASTLAASVIPNALRATAQGLDDRPRSTGYADTFAERLALEAKSRIPGLRETLPGSVDALGNERMYQGTTPERLFNSMLNPVGVNHYQQGELSKDLESLRERSGGNTSFYPTNRIPKEISYTDKGGKKHTAQMDYEQRQDFQRTRGTVTNGTMIAMTGTRAYKKASAERQVELMAKCQSYGYEVAKGGVLGKAAMESWAVNAQTSKKDVGLSAVEFLALYTDDRYKSYLSGKAYEKTKEAYRAGVSVEEYVGLKESADTNGNGTISKAEASAALAGQEHRADLWDIICTTNAKNPYK